MGGRDRLACGGAGRVSHVGDVVAEGKADAVCMASILHYKFIEDNDGDGDFSSEGNIEFLKSRRGFSKVQGTTLADVKEHFIFLGISCRPVAEQGVHV